MLNVITYARQVSGKYVCVARVVMLVVWKADAGRTESPSVIAEQRSLIEDLAHSNQDYVRKFEELKLGIEGTAVEHVDDAPNTGAIEKGPSTTTRSLPGAPTRKFGRTKFATGGVPLLENESTRSLSSRELATATRSPPKAQNNVTRSRASSPNAAVGNVFINTSIQTNIAMPPVQERGIPTTEPPKGFEQEALFKQLEHYSMLIKNLLKEVDEAQYKITLKSRLRVKGGIAGLHESERQELERIWGGTALQSAEQRLESMAEGLGEMPMMNRVAARDSGKDLSSSYLGRGKPSLPMTADLGFDNKEQEEAAGSIPQPIPDGNLSSHLDSGAAISSVEDRSNVPLLVDEAVAKGGRLIRLPEYRKTRSEQTGGASKTNYLVADPEHNYSDKKHIRPSNPVVRASTDERSTQDSTRNQMYMMAPGDMNTQIIRRKSAKGLALSVSPSAGNAKLSFGGQSPKGVPQSSGPTNNELTQEKLPLPVTKKRRENNNVASPSTSAQASTPRSDVKGTKYASVQNLGRRTGSKPRERTQILHGKDGRPKDARVSTSVESGEDQSANTQPVEGLGEEFRQDQEEFTAKGRE